MKGAFGIVGLYFTLFPVQRWLGVAALVLGALLGIAVAVSLMLGTTAGPRAALLPAFVTAPAIFIAPACLVAGAALRYFSAPRSHRLLPGFRVRMLGSIVAVALIVLGSVSIAVFAAGPISSGLPGAMAYLAVFAGVSAALYLSFRITRASSIAVLELAAGIGLLWLAPRMLVANYDPMLPILLAGLLMIGWFVFAFWYLRVPYIAPVDLLATSGGLAIKAGREIDRRIGTELLLSNRAPLRIANLIFAGLVAGLGLSLIYRFLLGAEAWDNSVQMEGIIALSVGIVIAMNMNQSSARARYLWLLGCGSRTALFSRLERLILVNLLLPVTLVASLMVSVHFVLLPLSPGRIVAAILLVAGFLPIAVYLSLIRLRNLGPWEIGLASICGGLSFGVYLGYARGGWGLAVVIAGFIVEVAVAAVLRYWTRRRWQRVDWLELRAARPAEYSPGFTGARSSRQ